MGLKYWSETPRANLVRFVEEAILYDWKIGKYTLRQAQNAISVLYGMYFIIELQ